MGAKDKESEKKFWCCLFVCLFVHILKTIQKENSFMESTSGLQKEHQMSVILQKHNETREILNNCSLQNVINFL